MEQSQTTFEFGIKEARSNNYMGPQENNFFKYSSAQVDRRGSNSTRSEFILDWNSLVDNVFMEEIDKLSSDVKMGLQRL